jgi:outer membrane lipoprotein SlyB
MLRGWLAIVVFALLAACAAPAPVEEPVRYGQVMQVDSVMIDGDQHLGVGAIIGAVAGGVIGHQFGGGSGQDVATVAGVLAGGVAGNKVQNKTEKRAAQHVIVKLDNGVSVGITQATDSVFKVGDRVRIDGAGNDARVVRI